MSNPPVPPHNLPELDGDRNDTGTKPKMPPSRRAPRLDLPEKPKRAANPPASNTADTPPRGVPAYVPVEQPHYPPPPSRKRKEDDYRDARERVIEPRHAPPRSGFYIPAWSILLTLMGVFACAAVMLAGVIALGGDAAPGGEPQIVIVTPMQTPTSPLDALLTTPTPTLQVIQSGDNTFFDLQGPTLMPVIFTPTPMGIALGVTIRVDVDGGLNVRPQPTTDNTPLFQAQYGELFTVVEGPENAQGLTWWRIQSLADPSRTGWAAGEFLFVVPPQ